MKRRHAAHPNHERWLVSYADFITLMFAFFVVMFSSAQVDKRKVGRLARAIQAAFQELGVFQASNSRMPLATTEAMPFDDTQLVEKAVRTTALGQMVPSPEGMTSEALDVRGQAALQKELEQALAPELQRRDVAMKEQREGLVISLREVGFFDSGSASLRPGSEPSVARIAAVLGQRTCRIRIEGHTDNIPIHNGRFSSNWELSTARATELIKLFITRYHFAPTRLTAAGYSEFHPAASNDTAEGRAMNRRVDIVVLAAVLPAEPEQAAPTLAPSKTPEPAPVGASP